jgi:hypothetical protein
MFNETKRELFSGIQYLLIGISAEGIVLMWFDKGPPHLKMLVWAAAALTLSLLRFLILGLSSLFRRNQWTSISKRHWN